MRTTEAFEQAESSRSVKEADCKAAVKRFLSRNTNVGDDDLRIILTYARDDRPLPALEHYPDHCIFVCEVATVLLQRMKGRWWQARRPKNATRLRRDLELITAVPRLRATVGGLQIAQKAEQMLENFERA